MRRKAQIGDVLEGYSHKRFMPEGRAHPKAVYSWKRCIDDLCLCMAILGRRLRRVVTAILMHIGSMETRCYRQQVSHQGRDWHKGM